MKSILKEFKRNWATSITLLATITFYIYVLILYPMPVIAFTMALVFAGRLMFESLRGMFL